jgi:pimeloyl-ACP methyl ester carboxylesterase
MSGPANFPSRIRLLAAGASLALAACSPLARVDRHRPEWPPSTGASAGRQIEVTAKSNSRDPHAAIGGYLRAAEIAMQQLRKTPGDAASRQAYDFAISRVFSTINEAKLDAWSGPLEVAGYTLDHRPDRRAMWHAKDYDFVPVDELKIGGKDFREPVRRGGVGAPVIAIRREPLEDYRQHFFSSPHVYYGVTAVARFEGKRCVITFEDPLAKETVDLDGRRHPLAGDFTTSVAMQLERDRPDKLGLARLVRPGKYEQTMMLYRLQPYDPRRIPVVFVHGLESTPATWAGMHAEMLADPEIRRRYQFWFFSYPSGDPFPYSATLLRKELDRFNAAYPDHQKIVMVGHSMGGLLTRLMVTDSGEVIWRDIFGKSPAETKLSPDTKRMLEDALIFEHRPEIARAVFYSTPHRGSDYAANWIGRTISHFVHLPQNLVNASQDLISGSALQHGTMPLTRMPNSVDTLSPKAPFVKALDTLPIAPGIPYHQIAGDRGKGDSPDSSDGVVAYWSSHLATAESGRVVPSGHSSHANPEGIAELKRILKLHLKENPGK